MHRVTVTIPADLEQRVDQYLRQHPDDGDVSELLLNALRAYLLEEARRLDVINPDRPHRFLKISPADQGSGRSDISIEHDKYITEALTERKLSE